MLKVRQVKVEVLSNSDEKIVNALCKKLRVNEQDIISYEITKQSLDARDKSLIYYVYEFKVEIENEEKYINNQDIILDDSKEFTFPKNVNNNQRTVIVGSGPAGLFCAYMLAINGYKPIVIERGKPVEERIQDVNTFWEKGILNPESNVQFGEGGAGTFSDGKLNSNVKDKLKDEVFKIFYENGAPKEILYSYMPHIGTDKLIDILKNMRKKIIDNGGKILFNTKLTNIIYDNNIIKSIEVNNKDVIDCDNLVLAIGHSARDTFKMLYDNKLDMESKPFAVGLRVSHSQKMIDESQYGKKYADILSKASYKLTYQTKSNRGVYSFCMCPGGYVVNSSSEGNSLAINGMSNYLRDTDNANSAIVITVNSNDYGNHVLDGIEFQRRLERKAFELGNGKIPVQLLKDYKDDRVSLKFGSVQPIFKGAYTFANLNELFTENINNDLKEAFAYFDKKIQGFGNDDTILAGIESRTSSPVRIIRNVSLESNIKGIYPAGEGAGYAGGITSAAIDGIKIALMIAQKKNDY